MFIESSKNKVRELKETLQDFFENVVKLNCLQLCSISVDDIRHDLWQVAIEKCLDADLLEHLKELLKGSY